MVHAQDVAKKNGDSKSKSGSGNGHSCSSPARMRRKSRHASPSFEDEEDEDDPIYVHGDEGYSPNLRGNYFRDGQTKIALREAPSPWPAARPDRSPLPFAPADFVLVWEEKVRPPKKRRGKLAAHEARGDRPRGHHEHWRRKFLNNLRNAGLLMEKEEMLSERKTIHYLKLSAPWDVLVFYAEELCLRAPLQAQPNPDWNSSAEVLRRLCIPNALHQHVPNKPADYYTCAFRRSKLDKFLGSDSRDSYFSNTQRHRIVYEILARTIYGKRKRAEIGINRLLNERVYGAAFPLHEGPFETPESEVPDEALNPRQVLYRFWAQWGCWYRYQPLDHIRQYFGEKIAIYFAWLGFYTAWLLPAAAVGTVVFLAGLVAMGTNTPAWCEPGSHRPADPRSAAPSAKSTLARAHAEQEPSKSRLGAALWSSHTWTLHQSLGMLMGAFP
ncbi:anoctamin-7-like isoform X2 [Mauremys reevesii]|uniref:anoctamin-7-like isoform X2 n=1 Tax=Mauremys reevesii TaxID=260615 RepID=UPI00193F1433|nr:anoctamin-7-like isoform X2 [Mauremys reevesii]